MEMYRLTFIIGLTLFLFPFQSCKNQTQSDSAILPEKVSEIKAKLGEGSIWDSRKQVLYWIDIEEGILFEFDPVHNATKSHNAGKKIGTIVPETDTTVVLALQDGVYRMFLENDSLEFIVKPPSLLENQRFNDGKCDPQGRFWVGALGPGKSCFLYCLDNDGIISERLDSITTSNGIIWSPDSTKMYYTDTNTSKVRQFDFDNRTGQISNEKVIIEVPDSLGYPDGMTIDSEGKLWIALWKGYGVYRFDPETGKLMQKIPVQAKNITSCAFGGKELDVLYITSASIDMNAEESLQYPDAGKLLRIKPGVKGIKSNYIKLQ
jgi:sugar lactone lactonase YvrE